MAADEDPGLALHGGTTNAGLVVRAGDTVRRPTLPTHPATHALLAHLDAVGFEGAPRFLGMDRLGREVLSYVPGEAVTAPYPAWAMTGQALASVAALLRRFHDAAASFDPAPHRWPGPLPARFATGLVSHNDLNLDNVVFRDGRAVALIDFDLASPGSRLWDAAGAVRLWAPLCPPEDIRPELGDTRGGGELERAHLFLDAYGDLDLDRSLLVDAVRASHGWTYDVVRAGAERGNPGLALLWGGGGRERTERARQWLAGSDRALRAALARPAGG